MTSPPPPLRGPPPPSPAPPRRTRRTLRWRARTANHSTRSPSPSRYRDGEGLRVEWLAVLARQRRVRLVRRGGAGLGGGGPRRGGGGDVMDEAHPTGLGWEGRGRARPP